MSNFSVNNNAKNFDNWTNGKQVTNNSQEKNKVEDFKMFDLDLSTYSKDLKDFSKNYIDLFDSNNDGKWNFNEFMDMAVGDLIDSQLEMNKAIWEKEMDGMEMPPDFEKEQKALLQEILKESQENYFKELNLDKNLEELTAEEFAATLFVSDLDYDTYKDTGFLADAIDGKINFDRYHTFNSGYVIEGKNGDINKELKYERQDFFNSFYGE